MASGGQIENRRFGTCAKFCRPTLPKLYLPSNGYYQYDMFLKSPEITTFSKPENRTPPTCPVEPRKCLQISGTTKSGQVNKLCHKSRPLPAPRKSFSRRRNQKIAYKISTYIDTPCAIITNPPTCNLSSNLALYRFPNRKQFNVISISATRKMGLFLPRRNEGREEHLVFSPTCYPLFTFQMRKSPYRMPSKRTRLMRLFCVDANAIHHGDNLTSSALTSARQSPWR